MLGLPRPQMQSRPSRSSRSLLCSIDYAATRARNLRSLLSNACGKWGSSSRTRLVTVQSDSWSGRVSGPSLNWSRIKVSKGCWSTDPDFYPSVLLTILHRPYLLLSASAKEEFIGKIDNVDHGDISQCDSVIIGLAPDMLDYTHLNQAFRILKREVVSNNSKGVPNKPADSNTKGKAAIPIIATHKAKYVQTSTGLSLGPGPFVTALESATGQTAQVVGKPTKSFFEIVLQDLQRDNSADGGVKSLTPEDSRSPQQTAVPGRGKGKIAVIGDDVEADLGEGAIELGLWRILGMSHISSLSICRKRKHFPSIVLRLSSCSFIVD